MTSTCRPGHLTPQILSAAAIIATLTKKTWSTRLPSLRAEGWDSFYIWLSSKVLVKFNYTETWFTQFRDISFFFFFIQFMCDATEKHRHHLDKRIDSVQVDISKIQTHIYTPTHLLLHDNISHFLQCGLFFFLLLIWLWHGAKVSIILCGRLNQYKVSCTNLSLLCKFGDQTKITATIYYTINTYWSHLKIWVVFFFFWKWREVNLWRPVGRVTTCNCAPSCQN